MKDKEVEEYDEISFISNQFVDIRKGFKFIAKNKFLILKKHEKRILLIKREFAKDYHGNPFLIRQDNKVILNPLYDNIHIEPRLEGLFRKHPNSYYIRISELYYFTKKSLAYVNIAKNIIKLDRDPDYNKYSSQVKENFYADDLTTEYKGFCSTYPKCLKWISKHSKINFYYNQNKPKPKRSMLDKPKPKKSMLGKLLFGDK